MPLEALVSLLIIMNENEWLQYLRPKRVCLCIGLSREDIENAIQKYNIKTFSQLQYYTKCSTCCKTCEINIKEILNQFLINNK